MRKSFAQDLGKLCKAKSKCLELLNLFSTGAASSFETRPSGAPQDGAERDEPEKKAARGRASFAARAERLGMTP
jgi:hypothetical protein